MEQCAVATRPDSSSWTGWASSFCGPAGQPGLPGAGLTLESWMAPAGLSCRHLSMSWQVSASTHSLPGATQVTRSPREEGLQKSQVKVPPSSIKSEAGRAIQLYFQAKMRGLDRGEGQPPMTHEEAGIWSSIHQPALCKD